MPIHWRRFYYNKLLEAKKKEHDQVNGAKQNNTNGTPPKTKVRK